MLYLSAQPDNSYFLWQLKVMLFNFELVGISSKSVHVLIGYDSVKGINPAFLDFEKQNDYGQLYFYPDERVSPKYRSSIRPHILAKHFKIYPSLSAEIIFYHDCDIIFREKLNEGLFKNNEVCYVSDASNYLNVNYINKFDGAFKLMTSVVGVDEKLVISNDFNTGGAQYVLKNISACFWEKLEHDCEALFVVMTNFNDGKEKPQQIQACCADMWALYWGLLKIGKQVEIHKELDFCWPKNELKRWGETKILHNAGVGPEEKGAFCKGHFSQSDPFFQIMESTREDLCTIKYVEQIRNYEKKLVADALSNLTFVLPLYKNSNISTQTKKEIQQNIINLLSEELEQRHIEHTAEELMIHAALSFGLGKKFFTVGNRREELNNWLAKVFSNSNFIKNHSKQTLTKMRNHIVTDCCGVKLINMKLMKN